MLNREVYRLLNEQVNKELYSAYLYLDMANYYISENLNGFGNWFAVQAKEEKDHAQLFMNYLLDNSQPVKLLPIAGPDKTFATFADPLTASLEHEQYVTASINAIYEAAFECRDRRTMQFLDWFVKEQMEEEKNADELIQKYKLFGSDGKGLYLLDSEMAARVYTPVVMTAV